MKTKLRHIAELAKARKEVKVVNVLYLLGDRVNLERCFGELKRGKAPGVDRVTMEEYEANLKENLEGLIARMKTWSYRPQPVQRVYIEKSDGKKRPLGIPAIEDKVVQMGVKNILEAIYEPDFLDCSYGFRPNRSCHQALGALDGMIRHNPVNFVIDADIKGFFDSVDHEWLTKFLEHRVGDKKLIRLVRRMLRSGIMEEGKFVPSEVGTPQGGVVSPLFANVYLHYVLDLWVEKIVKRKSHGFVGMVRYADDFVICVENEEEAGRILNELRDRLAKFKLELSAEKTRIVKFGGRSGGSGTFNFLSFTHYSSTKNMVGRKTEKKRFARALRSLGEWLRVIYMAPARNWWMNLCAKLRGHYQYYGVTGNSRLIRYFYFQAVRLVRKWLSRRSQRSRMNWKRFNLYLKRYPLPIPRIHQDLHAYGYGK